MITIQNGGIKPLTCSLEHVGSLAFDGCGYATLTPRCSSVTKLDGALCPVGTVHTQRRYANLCFDVQECCYWANADGTPGILYRLDAGFREMGRLAITGPCRRRLCGLGCDPCSGALLILYPDAVGSIDKESGVCTLLFCLKNAQMFLGLLPLCGGYLLAYMEDGIQYVGAYCFECDEWERICVPGEFNFEAIILSGTSQDQEAGCITYRVSLLLSKRCNRELVQMQLLVFCHREDVAPCPTPPCPPTPPCLCGKYEIMHSVALEEAGIAHILNAEGEKLQKAVAESCTIEELLAVNESVKQTITQITRLEGQLFSKLERVTETCGENPCAGGKGPCCGGCCDC